MKIRSSGSRMAKYIPIACLSLALAPSFIAIALARNAVSGPGTDAAEQTATLETMRLAADEPRGGAGANRPGGGVSRGAPSGREVPRGGILPPSARTTPRAHIPVRPEINVERPPFGRSGITFRGRDFARLEPRDLSLWRSGRWLHEEHAGYLGWWWVLGDEWYFYPEPIYLYPTFISDYLIPVPAPLSPQFWYYCDNPPGYYPDVQACYDAWQAIPIAPPPPLPPPVGPMANADLRAGFRIARNVCSACHVVQPGQPGGTVLIHPGPSFQEIANRPDTTPASLRAFITGTSWDMATRPITMPRQGLSEQSTQQVVTYVLSLRTQPPR
jgi:mono/diheme cytochrome c family protein